MTGMAFGPRLQPFAHTSAINNKYIFDCVIDVLFLSINVMPIAKISTMSLSLVGFPWWLHFEFLVKLYPEGLTFLNRNSYDTAFIIFLVSSNWNTNFLIQIHCVKHNTEKCTYVTFIILAEDR